MRLLGTYLWKEWRDHRAVLVGMVVAVPLLLAVMSFSLPWSLFDREHFPAYASLACVAMFVVSLATDLVPGEARRGHRWLLERLPGGLGAAFRGKLALFVSGGVFFAAYGFLGGAVTCRLVTGQWPPSPSVGTTTGIVAVLALWTFAVSCSLPRGALSLPALAVLALLLALPLVVCWQIDPWGAPKKWWHGVPLALWGVGGVVAAWAAFRRRGFLRSGRACLVVGAVCSMPYWADAAHDAYLWSGKSTITIMDGYVGEGGRFAFLSRARRMPGDPWWQHTIVLPPVIVDLETGAVREMDGASSWSSNQPDGCPQRYVYLSRPGGWWFDARTAEPAQPRPEDVQAAGRVATPHRLPDGRRVSALDGSLVAAADGGDIDVLEEKWGHCNAEGLGFGFGRYLYDPWRQRRYDRGKLGLKGCYGLYIRPGRWLVRKGKTPELFDPDARTLAPVVTPADVSCGSTILDDGRVFGARGDQQVLLDPESGVVTEVPLPPGSWFCDPFGRARRTPDGRRVFHVWGEKRSAFARFDPATGTFVKTAVLDGWARLLGCPTDDAAIVTNDAGLWRLPFGSDKAEEIWWAR